MKNIIRLSFTLSLFILISCETEVPIDNNNFIKIFGKESGSFGGSILELPDGRIILSGKVDVPAQDFINSGGVLVVNKVIEGSMAIIEADKNGNLLNMNLLPVSDHYTVPEFQMFDIADKAKIDDLIPTDDGGYMIIGQWRGIKIILPTDTIEASALSTSPFLMKVNSNLTIEFIRSFNGELGWDEVYRIHPIMHKLPNDNLGILMGFGIYTKPNDESLDTLFHGYSFIEIDQNGNEVSFNEFKDLTKAQKMAHDFTMSNNGEVILVGQQDNEFLATRINLDSGTEFARPFDDSGIGGTFPNINPMFIQPFGDGEYLMVYTHPPNDVLLNFLSEDLFSKQAIKINSRNNEYPRAVYITSNQEILVYTEFLEQSDLPAGYLYRLDRQGKRKFRIRIDGTPGDVIEAKDGTILVLSNPLFNGVIPKMRLTKYSADGNLF